jgi:hypothetical protein
MFIDAMQTNDVVGENGMPAHSTAGNALVDLFYFAGAARKVKADEIVAKFKAALAEDPQNALRCLAYVRDIRGGMGERRFFNICMAWLSTNRPRLASVMIPYVPFFGRWDDLTTTLDTSVAPEALDLWLDALDDAAGNNDTHSLAAKWFPRSGEWFGFARRTMGVDAKSLRKGLVQYSTTVEQKMSAREWERIDYSKLPSRALHMYRKAFANRDPQRYTAYQAAVAKGEAKMNAKTLFPSDVIAAVASDPYKRESVANQNAWNNLADICLNDQYVLPMCDVSGSMMGEPMNVSIGLGIYLSERNVGPFKDVVMTFAGNPKFHKLQGDIYAKYASLARAEWDMSTNLEKAFSIMLQRAVDSNVPANEMPTKLLIISDMQFNQATKAPSDNALAMIRKQYAAAGYEMPLVVFWNVRASTGVPAKSTTPGVNLVSGYSPNIMTSVLKGSANPLELILDTINADRYTVITVD